MEEERMDALCNLCNTPDSETTVSTALSLTVSRQNELQQRVADFRRGLLAEVQALVAECLTECLPEIDRALEECLVVPRLRLILPVGTSALVVEAVKESLRQRAANAWREDREVMHANAEYARRRMRTPPPLAEPVVMPIVTSGAPPLERPAERKFTLINNTVAAR